MGKLLILPLRQTVEIDNLPDLTIDLRPGAELPPELPPTPTVPPTVPPVQPPAPPSAPPPAQPPGSGDFPVLDIVNMLPVDHSNDPTPPTHLKESLTFHWEGGDPLNARTDEEVQNALVGIAIQHMARQWAPGVYGSGIMYHECIAPSGASLICRPYTDVLWHCGDENGNLTSRAILVYTSKATGITPQQRLAIRKRIADFSQNAGHQIPVHPHSYWSATECPGDEIRAILSTYGG